MKIILKICIFVIVAIVMSIGSATPQIQTPGNVAHAQEIITCETNQDCPPDEMAICMNKKCIDILTGKPLIRKDPERDTDREPQIDEKLPDAAEIVEGLPVVTIEVAIATTIQTILGWAMLITIIAIVVAAIYYLKSQGKEEDLSKAKNIIVYLIVGMAIMAAAYGIVTGIAEFDFFRGDELPE